ncbi:MAG: PDZ domain-containing protein, partial [Phycisphaerales bacterium]
PTVRVGIIPSNASDGGMRIERVFEDTSASQAGLRPGDRITKWDGTEIDAVETWMPILAEHKPGDTVILEVQRGDETLEMKMTLRGIE